MYDIVVLVLVAFFGGYVFGLFAIFLMIYPPSIDDADERRRLWKKSKVPAEIIHEDCWTPNARGMLLYEQVFVPANVRPKSLICICHGFGDNTASFPSDIAIMLCKRGYATIMLDYEGHGYSDGLHGYVRDINLVAGDVLSLIKRRLSETRFNGLNLFVYGESMGGAVAFELCLLDKTKSLINGAILMAPMLKIADELKPPLIVQNILLFLAHYIPRAPITPIEDLDDLSFKREDMKRKSKQNILGYKKYARLGTALAVLNATDRIAKFMEEFGHPVLIMHGSDDKVTCPTVSKEFHRRCYSTDKSIRIYENCVHSLLFGELPPRCDEIFSDMIAWLDERCK